MEYDIDADLHIDPNGLDVEWLAQANYMRKYTKLLSEAKKTVSLLKEKVDITEATVARKIRRRPQKYKIEKGTDKEIKEAVKLHKETRATRDELIEAEYEADVLLGVVRSFEHKKRALEKEVDLLNQNYYASPREPRNLDKEWDKRVKQRGARSKIKPQRKRRRK